MVSSRRRFLKVSAAAMATPLLPGAAWADWPKDKPIRAIIPFNAGSTIDIIGRIVVDPLSRQLGQTIVVENRGGAGGSIGAASVAKADPDGYTLLINAAAHSGAPAAYPNLSYDAAKDFACIASFGSVPNVLVVSPKLGVKTLKEFVVKAKAGKFTYASAGVGSATHWAAERFRISANFDGTHVPFRGGLEALTEVMTDRVDFMFGGTSSSLPFIKEGKLVALAVSSAKRSPSMPDVPTTVEEGFANSDYNFWNGLLAPAKTPRSIIDHLHAEVTKVLALPDIQQKLNAQGVEPSPLTPTEMDAMNAREIELNIKIAKAAGLKFN